MDTSEQQLNNIGIGIGIYIYRYMYRYICLLLLWTNFGDGLFTLRFLHEYLFMFRKSKLNLNYVNPLIIYTYLFFQGRS